MEAFPTIRLARDGDSRALAELMARCPDAGRVSFGYRFGADLLQVMRGLATRLDAAVAADQGRLLGMVFGDFADVLWSGLRRPGVYVSNLRVDPEHRGRGIARALADFGLDYAGQRLGEGALFYSAVLEGNASAAWLGKLGFQATEPIHGALVPLRRRPPPAEPGLQVRPATRDDWPRVAEGMNAFYAEHNLWSPVSALSLAEWAAREVAGLRPNRHFVALREGEVVAGISVSNRTPLVRMVATGISPLLRGLGRALGLLAADGSLPALSVRQAWYRPGRAAAARGLWQTLRFALRAEGGCFGIAYDPRDPLAAVFRLPRWLPVFPARYLVRAPAPLETGRPTYCTAGA